MSAAAPSTPFRTESLALLFAELQSANTDLTSLPVASVLKTHGIAVDDDSSVQLSKDMDESSFTSTLLAVLGDPQHVPVRAFVDVVSELDPRTWSTRLRFFYPESALQSLTDEIIAATDAVAERVVAAVAAGDVTFASTLGALEAHSLAMSTLKSSVEFVGEVHPEASIRDASTECDKRLSEHSVKFWMREDLYLAVRAFSETEEAKGLTGEDARLLEHTMRDFRRLGLELDEEKRARLTELKTRMSELAIQFRKNLAEDKSTLEFTEAELEGLPSDLLASLDKSEADESKRVLTLKYPHYFPCVRHVKVPETRQAMEAAFNRRAMDTNTGILEELVELRAEMAGLLGYDTFADYILETRMAKNAATVHKFLGELNEKLAPLAEKEMAKLLELKKEEVGEEAFDGVIHPYDFRYYMRMVEERQFDVDHDALKQYFPLEVVLEGMLNFYQNLLSLRFEEVKNPHTWHPQVQLYACYDNRGGDTQDELVGHFYLDLHPREGKFGHAACWGLQPGGRTDECHQLPAVALVCNFTEPTPEKPSLLQHDECVTLYHEFGHAMHGVCSLARHVSFAGTRVERDFVESPSQMLENWCWERESLLEMSGHVDDHSVKLPEDLLNKLVASRNANVGLLSKRQLTFGFFDQRIHTSTKADVVQVFADTQKEVLGIAPTPGTSFPANFGHLAGGYAAQYYGYLYSETMSADMFVSRFKKEGIMNKETGLSYRQEILSVGGSRDAMDSLVAFLGREPIMEPFLTSKGLE